MYLNDDITQRSPLFRELIRWIDEHFGDGTTYNDYLADLLRRIEDHYEVPTEDDELDVADWIDREAAEE